MARTPLFGWLQQAASVAAEAATRNVPTDKVIAVPSRLSGDSAGATC
jgi:hypothetical protein